MTNSAQRLTGLEEIKISSSFYFKYLTFRNASGFQSNPTEKIREIKSQFGFYVNLFKKIAFPRAVPYECAEKMGMWAAMGGTIEWLEGNVRAPVSLWGLGVEAITGGKKWRQK